MDIFCIFALLINLHYIKVL